MALKTNSKLMFHSSDHELELGFDRLKNQALYWVFEGYPVGDYYEAALPNRDAFCMRDTSHQCIGAEVLGLHSHNLNMFLKFAEGISESRDWCSHWEIDRYDRSCPVDYKDDTDFWYNLPANFDVLDALWRMYRWSGDETYVKDDRFDYFCVQTMEAYIARWDRDSDGLPDRVVAEGRRGLVSYDESPEASRKLKVGTDLLAVMARAHLSFAKICRQLGRAEQRAIYEKRGLALLDKLNNEWHDPEKGYAEGLGFDGQLIYTSKDHAGGLLYWDVVPVERTARMVEEYWARVDTAQIEGFSHYPEILWRYGRQDLAMKAMRRSMDPNLYRREYPEASFCAIGALATGMMGICPDASKGMVSTLPGMDDVKWAKLMHVPVLGGMITVEHRGNGSTILTNEGDRELTWRACFEVNRNINFWINGAGAVSAPETLDTGRQVRYVEIIVPAGQSARVDARP